MYGHRSRKLGHTFDCKFQVLGGIRPFGLPRRIGHVHSYGNNPQGLYSQIPSSCRRKLAHLAPAYARLDIEAVVGGLAVLVAARKRANYSKRIEVLPLE